MWCWMSTRTYGSVSYTHLDVYKRQGYDEKLAELERELLEIDGLLSDFNRELADYVENMEYDEETFYQVEKRLDEVNHLKSKYGSTIPDVLLALEEKQERLMQLKEMCIRDSTCGIFFYYVKIFTFQTPIFCFLQARASLLRSLLLSP